MKRHRHTPEQIVRKLREGERLFTLRERRTTVRITKSSPRAAVRSRRHREIASLILVGSLLIIIGGCTNQTPIPPAQNDKAPKISLLPDSIGGTSGAHIYPAIAQSSGPTSSQVIGAFPASGLYRIVARAFNPGGVKRLSISATRAGTELFSGVASGTESNGTVPDSLQVSESGGREFLFTLDFGPVIVTTDATNFNDMSTHFVATYAVAPDPVVHMTTTSICTQLTPGGVTLTADVDDLAPVTSLTGSWWREEFTSSGQQTLTQPKKIVLHSQSDNKWTSAPGNFFPIINTHNRLQAIHVEVEGGDLFGREISHRISTDLTSWDLGECNVPD
jgi:hypothetical protein